MRVRLVGLLTLLLCSYQSFGQVQEVKFSQFFNFPMHINAAATGKFDESYRVSGIYRRQWNSIGSEFVTTAVGGDVKLNAGFRSQDRIGVGLYLLDDHLGDNIMQHQGINVSGAYHFPLDFQQQHTLSLGVGVSYHITSVNIDQLIFESQFQGFVPDASIANGEPFVNERQSNLDLSASIAYSYVVNPDLQISVAYAQLDLLKPQQSFFSDTIASPTLLKQAVVGSIDYKVNSRLSLMPKYLIHIEQNTIEVNTGLIAGYMAVPDKKFRVDMGIMGQWSEYLALYSGIGLGSLEVHASYDFSMAGLKQLANATNTSQSKPGVFELSIVYKGRTKRNDGQYSVPCRIF